MKAAERVIVNTAVQYIKTVIGLVLSLYSTRLILSALGIDDYGIYTLIGGVVSLLSFVVNALVISTQRFLSYNAGKDNLKIIFSNSLLIHIALGIVFFLLMEILSPLILNNLLDIPADRQSAAVYVFQAVIIMVLLSFITSPFKALLISHENIVYVSAIDLSDAILKFLIAMSLHNVDCDRLVLYSFLLCSVNLLNLIAFSIYDFFKYDECVMPRIHHIDKSYIYEMVSFTSWTTFNVLCITGRTQGISVIINRFFSLAINTAYGLALQVSSALAFLSQSIRNALNPQIMKAEGMGDRAKMLYLAELESKFCLLLMGIVLVPCLFEMESLIQLWLKEVPDYSVSFCRALIVANIIDQITIGLEAANQAYGKIKWYSLIVNSIKLLTIPAIIMALYYYNNLFVVLVGFILFEFLSAVARLIILKYQTGLSVFNYLYNVIAKSILPLLMTIVISYGIIKLSDFKFRFVISLILSVTVGGVSTIFFSFSRQEKLRLFDILKKIVHR